MAKPIAKLSVMLTANTSRFIKGMNKSTRSITVMAKVMGRAALRVGKLGVAFGLAAATGLALLINKERQAIDALGKLSTTTGASIKTIQALRVAADETGLGADQMSQAMAVLTKRVGEAALGTGEALKWFEKMGISIDDLLKAKPGKQFKLIADGVKALTTQSERNAAASAIFSRANQKIVNLLQLGSDELEKYEKLVKKLGLSLKKIDVRQVEKMNDRLGRAKLLLRGFSLQITAQLAETITRATEAFLEWGTSGEGAANLVTKAIKKTGRAVSALADAYTTAAASVEDFRAANLRFFGDFFAGFSKIAGPMNRLENFIKSPNERRKQGFMQQPDFLALATGFRQAAAEAALESALIRGRAPGDKIRRMMDNLTSGVDDLAASQNDAVKATDNQSRANDKLLKSQKALRSGSLFQGKLLRVAFGSPGGGAPQQAPGKRKPLPFGGGGPLPGLQFPAPALPPAFAPRNKPGPLLNSKDLATQSEVLRVLERIEKNTKPVPAGGRVPE